MASILEYKNYKYDTPVGEIKYLIQKRELLGKEYFTGYMYLEKNIFTEKFIGDNLQYLPFFGGYTFFDEYNDSYEIGFDTNHYSGDKLFRTFKDVEKHMIYVIDSAVQALKKNGIIEMMEKEFVNKLFKED